MEVVEKDGTQSAVAIPTLSNEIGTTDLVPLGKFDDEKRRRVAQIDQTVSLRDTNSIEGFAVAPQRKISTFLDQLLAGVKAGELGEAGEMVAELSSAVKRVDLPGMRKQAETGGRSVMESVPVVGKALGRFFDSAKRYQAMQKDIVDHIAKIESKATLYMGKLKSGTSNMDRLLDATEQDLRELEVWLAGGQQALLRLRAEYQAESALAIQTRDPIHLAKLRDMSEQINAFETRLVRLSLAFTSGLLSVPQIRSAQVAGRIEFQNTMDTVLTDIPDIKRAVFQIANLRQISKATDASEARRELRRNLGVLGADMLDTVYTKAKETQGNMAADVTALANLTEKTLATIEKGAQIDVANRGKRAEAVRQIGEVKQRLIEGLTAQAQQSVAL